MVQTVHQMEMTMIDRNDIHLANFGGVKQGYLVVRGNTYPIKDQIKAIGGRWDANNKVWMIPEFRADYIEGLMKAKGLDAPKAEPVREANLNFAGISKLFSESSLKRPVIKLTATDGVNIRLSVAGGQSKEPGSIIVTTDAAYENRTYIGRISTTGVYTGAFRYAAQPPVVECLKAFSADPVAVAREYGRKTGSCCFCSRELTDKRSLLVGYGPICAGNYGLPWGEILADEEDRDPGNEAEARMVQEEINACEQDVFEKEGEITARVGAYNPGRV
jgi:hypothetical protein